MPCNLSETTVILVQVSRILKETLMLLKPLNRMRFNVLSMLSGRQTLLSSEHISYKSNSASNALGNGMSSLKRSANCLSS